MAQISSVKAPTSFKFPKPGIRAVATLFWKFKSVADHKPSAVARETTTPSK